MRRTLLLLSLFSLSCSNDLGPTGEVTGTWAADFGLPGASLVVQLSQVGDALSGTGTYTIEAGRAGTLQVAGTYSHPIITLALRYDYGLIETYSGRLVDAQHITGTLADSLGQGFELNFTRR